MEVEVIQRREALLQLDAVRMFRDLVDSVPQIMAAIKDHCGLYVYANRGFCARLGKEQAQIVGRGVPDFFSGELASSYVEQDRSVLTSGQALQNHLELIVRTDGSLGWYVTAKSPLRDLAGHVVGVCVLSVDLHSQVASAHAGLARVIAAVRADVSQRWKVEQLAAVADLSTVQLERLSRRTLGLSPQALVQRLRIEESVRLMRSGGATLGEISALCGFYDQASFTRQFRKVLGLTPGAYRRSG